MTTALSVLWATNESLALSVLEIPSPWRAIRASRKKSHDNGAASANSASPHTIFVSTGGNDDPKSTVTYTSASFPPYFNGFGRFLDGWGPGFVTLAWHSV